MASSAETLQASGLERMLAMCRSKLSRPSHENEEPQQRRSNADFDAFKKKVACDGASLGLRTSEAEKLLVKHGHNEFYRDKDALRPHVLGYTLVSVQSLAMLALLYTSSAPWLSSVLVSIAVLGRLGHEIYTEWHAQDLVSIIKGKLAPPPSKVIRDGVLSHVKAEKLVVGDVVYLDRVLIPADGRILASTANFSVHEPHLTGKKIVPKSTGDVVYSTATIMHGQAYMLVTQTGNNTLLGRALPLMSGDYPRDPRAPPNHRFTGMPRIAAKMLLVSALPVALLVCALWSLNSQPVLYHMLVFSASMALVSCPVGLARDVRTIYSLHLAALGVSGALLRRAHAIDELARMDVLVCDKTGTVTINELHCAEPFCVGVFSWRDVLATAGLTIPPVEKRTGALDCIDRAIQRCLDHYPAIQNHCSTYEHIEHAPFDPHIKICGRTCKTADGPVITCIKGAPLFVLRAVQRFDPVPDHIQQSYTRGLSELVSKGYRCIGVARKIGDGPWHVLGLFPLQEHMRPQTPNAVLQANAMGISTKLVTGVDSLPLASFVAQRANLGSRIKSVDQLRLGLGKATDMSAENQEAVAQTDVFIRVFPQHKYEIVQSVQRRGLVVGVTADAHYDFHTLTRADVAIAVRGASASAQAASDIVFCKDGLHSIVHATGVARQAAHMLKSAVMYRVSLSVHLQFLLGMWATVLQKPMDPALLVLLMVLQDFVPSNVQSFFPWASMVTSKLDVRRLLSLSLFTALVLIGGSSSMLVLPRLAGSDSYSLSGEHLGGYRGRMMALHVILVGSWLMLATGSVFPFRLVKHTKIALAKIIILDLASTFICCTGYLTPYDGTPLPLFMAPYVWIFSAAVVFATLLVESILGRISDFKLARGNITSRPHEGHVEEKGDGHIV